MITTEKCQICRLKLNSLSLYYCVEEGGDKSEDGLRGMRKEGEEIGGGNERRDGGGGGPQTEQAHGGGLRGFQQGSEPGPPSDREGGRALALCTVRRR